MRVLLIGLDGIRLLKERFSPKKLRCFILTGYSTSFEEDMYRFRILLENNVDPFVMKFNNCHDLKLRHFARYCNSRIYKTVNNFDDSLPWAKGRDSYERPLGLC